MPNEGKHFYFLNVPKNHGLIRLRLIRLLRQRQEKNKEKDKQIQDMLEKLKEKQNERRVSLESRKGIYHFLS